MQSDEYILKIEKIAASEKVLSKAFGGSIRLEVDRPAGKGSNRAHIVRCKVLDGPPGAPESVIVKYVQLQKGETYAPDEPGTREKITPAARLFNEWASLQFLTEISDGVPPAPRFYGGDRATGLMVMEDMGVGTSLVQPLLGKDPVAAKEALNAYFTALGRLNALTVGKETLYDRIRDQLGPPIRRPSNEVERERLLKIFNDACTVIGVEPCWGYDSEMQRVARYVSDPGPFLALSQTDTCPDNCLRMGSEMRLLDFEFGVFQHALNDGSRARSNFPTCWCVYRLPEQVIQQVETVYRAELVKRCPEAADDTRFYHAITEACIYWTIESLGMFMPRILEQDERWGTSMVRQRLLVRLDTIVRTTAEYEYLEALGATTHRMVAKLRTLWPPEADQMPYYPAFQ